MLILEKFKDLKLKTALKLRPSRIPTEITKIIKSKGITINTRTSGFGSMKIDGTKIRIAFEPTTYGTAKINLYADNEVISFEVEQNLTLKQLADIIIDKARQLKKASEKVDRLEKQLDKLLQQYNVELTPGPEFGKQELVFKNFKAKHITQNKKYWYVLGVIKLLKTVIVDRKHKPRFCKELDQIFTNLETAWLIIDIHKKEFLDFIYKWLKLYHEMGYIYDGSLVSYLKAADAAAAIKVGMFKGKESLSSIKRIFTAKVLKRIRTAKEIVDELEAKIASNKSIIIKILFAD